MLFWSDLELLASSEPAAGPVCLVLGQQQSKKHVLLKDITPKLQDEEPPGRITMGSLAVS